MKSFLKLIIVLSTFIMGFATAEPMVSKGQNNGHAYRLQDHNRHYPYKRQNAPMMKTGLNDHSRNRSFRSKRMTADERRHLRNQIKEAGRMDFYR